jgi:hypothetical protein
VAAGEEEPALASVLAVAALAECPEAVARVQVVLAPAEVQGQRVTQAAFGSLAVGVPAPEGVWEPVAPRVEERATVRAADQARVPEDRVVPVVGLVEVAGVALAPGVAARALEAELALAAVVELG